MDPFLSLYHQHVEQVYRYHLARTGCPAEAEDLTAETFRAALEAFDACARERPPRPGCSASPGTSCSIPCGRPTGASGACCPWRP